MRHVRIVLCDDHELVRRGVSSLLDDVPEFEVVGEAADADAALSVVEDVHPDVVVMDVRLPSRSGIEACREIRSAHPETHVLMLTSFADEDAITSSIMAGASGYVLKQVRGTDLIGAIRDVAGGRTLLDPVLTERALVRLRERRTEPLVEELSAQEGRILDLVGEGLTNRQIAGRMGLAEKTVKNYVSNILGKLGLSRRTQAAAYVLGRPPPTFESGDESIGWPRAPVHQGGPRVPQHPRSR
jgi:two-component system response regulator DevR